MKQQENNFEYKVVCEQGFWVSSLPNLDSKKLGNYLYDLKNNTPTVYKSNSGGYQTESNLHYNPLFFPLVQNINNIGARFTSNPNIKLTGLWGNISSFSNFNLIHYHDHEIKLSGVIYLKVPKDSGRIIFYNPIEIGKIYPFSPKEKDIILFPSNLLHSVEPNLSQEDRISIAFNFS